MQTNKIEELKNYHFIIGSKSPRRHLLIDGMGLNYRIQTKDVEENYPKELKGGAIAEYLSCIKADAFDSKELQENEILITADTIVCQEGSLLLKPKDREDAIRTIEKLSGKSHFVYTGVCLKNKHKQLSFIAPTEVIFKELSRKEIEFYVDNYSPYDKAGAYGAQEWIGYIAIKEIKGSYFNVMGLPTHLLYEKIIEFIR